MNSTEAIANAERLLQRSLELGALQYGEFKLSAGATTNFYFDGRLLTTDGESVEILTALFLDILMRRNIHHFGGPAVAAVPIIGGMVLAAHQNSYDLKGYFVRSEQKSYGLEKKIEGHLSPNDKVALWDDTLSTGCRAPRVLGRGQHSSSKRRLHTLHHGSTPRRNGKAQTTLNASLQHPHQQR